MCLKACSVFAEEVGKNDQENPHGASFGVNGHRRVPVSAFMYVENAVSARVMYIVSFNPVFGFRQDEEN